MHPAFSVIFLTTLIGAGQGLFMALVTGQVYSLANLLEPQDSVTFYATGSLLAHGFAGPRAGGRVLPSRQAELLPDARLAGIDASGARPGCRVKLIALPAFMGLVDTVRGCTLSRLHPALDGDQGAAADRCNAGCWGLSGVMFAIVLFVCTAMIYASLRFLQEWHSPLTVTNFILFGLASGFTLAAAFSAWSGVRLVGVLWHLGGDLHRAGGDHARFLDVSQRPHQAQVDPAQRDRCAPHEYPAEIHGLHGRLFQHARVLPRRQRRHAGFRQGRSSW